MEPILHYILKRLIYMQALDRCHPYILSDEINVRKRNETSIVIYNTVAYFGYETTVYNDIPLLTFEKGIIPHPPPPPPFLSYLIIKCNSSKNI